MATDLIAALANEQPRGIEFPLAQVGADHAHLVAGQRLVRRLSALHAVNPYPRGLEVDLVDAQAAGLDGPQAVLEDHSQEQVIAGAVASVLGGGKQRSDLAPGEKVLGPARQIVRLRPRLGGTLTFTAAGGGCHRLVFPGQITRPSLSLFPFGTKGKESASPSLFAQRRDLPIEPGKVLFPTQPVRICLGESCDDGAA